MWADFCRVLDLDALITAKKAANRLKDRLAIPELEAISATFRRIRRPRRESGTVRVYPPESDTPEPQD